MWRGKREKEMYLLISPRLSGLLICVLILNSKHKPWRLQQRVDFDQTRSCKITTIEEELGMADS